MNYDKLIEFEDIFETRKRLIAYSNHYLKININGLHYVNFDKKSATISISHPNHRTDHLATCFLMKDKELKSINTVRGYAYGLKLFLDYLMIWNIDLSNCDLMYVLTGFVSYLMCVEEKPCPKNFANTSYFYSTLRKIPLNNSALSCGKVITIEFNRDGFKEATKWECRSYDSARKILGTAVKYIKYLKQKTVKYKDLNIKEIPVRTVRVKHSVEGGTLGNGQVVRTDLDYLLNNAGFKKDGSEQLLFRSVTEVMRLKDIDCLINAIPSHNYQNKLLFIILKCFGLREGEASNIQVDTSRISSNLMFMDKDKGIENLKQNLKGDIEYSEDIDTWVCHVSKSNSTNYDRQSKTGARTVPLVLCKGEFEQALLYGLIDRKIIMSSVKKENTHNYLLVCKGNNLESRGEPIGGGTVSKRFHDLSNKLKKYTGIDLTKFSPHDIRHFYATHLISSTKYAIYDVSRYLGHSGIETTIKTYYHFIKIEFLEDEGEETVKIYNKFKEMRDKANGTKMD